MKKRTAAVLLAMTLAFSMFGCGSESKQEKSQEAEQVQEDQQQKQEQSQEEQQEEEQQQQEQQEQEQEQESESKEEQETGADVTEEPVLDEQHQKVNDAMALIDEDKTYTVEEFHALMKDIAEALGTNYSSGIMEKKPWFSEMKLNLNGKEMKKIFEEEDILWLMLEGVTGDPMDSFIPIPEDTDTEGEFTVNFFYMPHQAEQ